MLCSNQLSYVANGAHYSLVRGMCQANILKFSLFYQPLKVFRPLDGNILLKSGTLTDLHVHSSVVRKPLWLLATLK